MKSSGYNDEKAESESERLTGEVDKIREMEGVVSTTTHFVLK